MWEIFNPILTWLRDLLDNRLTATRAGLLDNLDTAVSSRAAASTALSNETWTAALAAALSAVKQRAPTSYIGNGNAFVTISFGIIGARLVYSGAMTANTLKTVVSHSGAGVLNLVAIKTSETAVQTLRVKVTLDGVVVVDPGATTSINLAANTGIVPVGSVAGFFDGTYNWASVIPAKLNYNSSLLVEIASSVSATDYLRMYIAREVH